MEDCVLDADGGGVVLTIFDAFIGRFLSGVRKGDDIIPCSADVLEVGDAVSDVIIIACDVFVEDCCEAGDGDGGGVCNDGDGGVITLFTAIVASVVGCFAVDDGSESCCR
jgi:hypothetical protein